MQRPHYVLLTVGAGAVVLGLVTLFQRQNGWQVYLIAGFLWCGFSSGYGQMVFEKERRTVTARKTWFGYTRVYVIPFSDIRYGEAARVKNNSFFQLVLRGGRTLALTSSANLINNASEVADAVNEFLGLYPPGLAPPAAQSGPSTGRL